MFRKNILEDTCADRALLIYIYMEYQPSNLVHPSAFGKRGGTKGKRAVTSKRRSGARSTEPRNYEKRKFEISPSPLFPFVPPPSTNPEGRRGREC
jgi:hypothetical protein